jgi:hypothetical protein
MTASVDILTGKKSVAGLSPQSPFSSQGERLEGAVIH